MKENKDILAKDGVFTKKEIFQQPQMWNKTFELIESYKPKIVSFFKSFSGEDVDIILTGAGSSAFIGNAVSGVALKCSQRQTRAIPTTEMITHPEYFIQKNKTTVLVSFARSGNSPESLAAVKIVNDYCRESWNIIITCNQTGELYKKADPEKTLFILLPSETNDVSLAMTSSFTSMMLSYILIAKIDNLEQESNKVKELSKCGDLILTRYENAIADLASLNFKRAVFLGSGPLRGTAEESHLKLQELTSGKVICAFNSFLGFRHGPRAVVNDETLLVYLFSDDEYSRKYEYDMVRQINQNQKGIAQVAVSHMPVAIEGVKFDLNVCFGDENSSEFDIEYLCVAEVMIAQLLGYYKSISCGLNPDSPSVSGTISRVVEGVKIYNYK